MAAGGETTKSRFPPARPARGDGYRGTAHPFGLMLS
jgi:hypothetical protein